MTQPQQPQTPAPGSDLALVVAAFPAIYEANALAVLALEEKAALALVSAFRRNLRTVANRASQVWLSTVGNLSVSATPAQLATVVAELRRAVADVQIPENAQVKLDNYAAQAQRLGMRQAKAELEAAHIPTSPLPQVPTAQALPVTGLLARIRRDMDRVQRQLAVLPAESSYPAVVAAIAPVNYGARHLDTAARFAVNRAAAQGATITSIHERAVRIWWPENDACQYCLALGGTIAGPNGFDGSRCFGSAHPLPVYPAGPLLGPPRHPNCRCREVVWKRSAVGLYADLPAAIKRESERSIALGRKLPTESNAARRRAARVLLGRNPNLPAVVKARSAQYAEGLLRSAS